MPVNQQQRAFMCAICGDNIKPKPGQQLPSKPVACEACRAEIKKTDRPTQDYLIKLADLLKAHLPPYAVRMAIKQARSHAGGKMMGRITQAIRQNLEITKTVSGIRVIKKVLTSQERKQLPSTAFAIPERRAYPIQDEAHAHNALSRVSQFGSEADKKRVRAAVKKRYPNIDISKTEIIKSVGDKLDKAITDYRDASMEEKQGGFSCATCGLFQYDGDTGSCSVIDGTIMPDNICDIWRPSDHYINAVDHMMKSQPDTGDMHIDGLINMDELCKFESPDDLE